MLTPYLDVITCIKTFDFGNIRNAMRDLHHVYSYMYLGLSFQYSYRVIGNLLP